MARAGRPRGQYPEALDVDLRLSAPTALSRADVPSAPARRPPGGGFGLCLPDELKVGVRSGKVSLRGRTQGFLPADQLYRPEAPLPGAVGEWPRGDFLDRIDGKLAANAAVRT
jgi:hypothetical protein